MFKRPERLGTGEGAGIIAAYLAANLVMAVLIWVSARRIAPRIRIPRSYLLSAILVFCVAGSHAINTSFIDVRTMLGFGVVGLARESARVPLGPFVIGVGLTPIAEVQLRAAMMMSGDDPSAILTRPFAMGFLTLALLTLAWPGLAARRARRNIANQTE